MNTDKSAIRMIAMLGGVILLAVVVAIAWRYFAAPVIEEKKAEEAKQQAEKEMFQGDNIRIGIEPFAGYAVLRSPEFNGFLAEDNLHAVIMDMPDYNERMSALESGEIHMAAMTIDSTLVVGNKSDSYPGLIFFTIDESRGADGVATFKKVIPNVEALNRPDAQIVLTPDSPDETLTRHMISGMLPALSGNDKWMIKANGADEVYRQLRRDSGTLPRAYVLYEPALSRALEVEGVHLIYDSSNIPSTIMDVMVVNRRYLEAEPIKVLQVTEAYFRALYYHTSKPDGIVQLLLADGKQTGDMPSEAQARRMAQGILFKNCMENYAHFGIVPVDVSRGLPRLDTVIGQIARLLQKTGKLDGYTRAGREQELYTTQILASMHQQNFLPGVGQDENMRGNTELPALSEDQWKTLVIVGTMDAQTIDFRRGQSEPSTQGKRDLEDIAQRITAWPNFYLEVIGHARAEGDPEANKRLAFNRAQAVGNQLLLLGINPNRVHITAAEPTATDGRGQSVTFTLLRHAY